MVKIKICGITKLEDALAAQKLKVDMLGFVFYKKSPRFITVSRAKEIISKLNKLILKTGVFVNAGESYVCRIAKSCSLNILQFHGDETAEFCGKFPGYKIIKSFRVKNKVSLSKTNAFSKVDYFLFDAFKLGKAGGTGSVFNWKLLKGAKISKPFFLSGGLNSDNVVSAIRRVHPDWVDVSSGVEEYPGKKNQRLLKEFVEEAKGWKN